MPATPCHEPCLPHIRTSDSRSPLISSLCFLHHVWLSRRRRRAPRVARRLTGVAAPARAVRAVCDLHGIFAPHLLSADEAPTPLVSAAQRSEQHEQRATTAPRECGVTRRRGGRRARRQRRRRGRGHGYSGGRRQGRRDRQRRGQGHRARRARSGAARQAGARSVPRAAATARAERSKCRDGRCGARGGRERAPTARKSRQRRAPLACGRRGDPAAGAARSGRRRVSGGALSTGRGHGQSRRGRVAGDIACDETRGGRRSIAEGGVGGAGRCDQTLDTLDQQIIRVKKNDLDRMTHVVVERRLAPPSL